MKLAFVTETFPPEINGVAMTFGVIARELGLRGHQVTVYRPSRPDLPGDRSHPEYREVPLPGFPIPGYAMLRLGLPAARRLKKRWREDRPDLVHVATEGPLGSSAITAAGVLGIPTTSSFHTNFHAYAGHYGFAPLQRLALAWLRRVHNRTRRTFAPTVELCAELEAAGFRRMALLSRGVDIRQFSPTLRSPKVRLALGIMPEAPVVIHAGRLAREKDYPLLFKIYAAMREANPRLRFVVVGGGPLDQKLRDEHRDCIFTGFISRQELARQYASADIYIHASRTETFGNVLVEAMASGLAVAGFDYAAARQFVRNGENGLSVPFTQPAALIAAGVKLATDAALRGRLGAAATEAVARHSWEHVIARFEADLIAVVAESSRPLALLPALGTVT